MRLREWVGRLRAWVRRLRDWVRRLREDWRKIVFGKEDALRFTPGYGQQIIFICLLYNCTYLHIDSEILAITDNSLPPLKIQKEQKKGGNSENN